MTRHQDVTHVDENLCSNAALMFAAISCSLSHFKRASCAARMAASCLSCDIACARVSSDDPMRTDCLMTARVDIGRTC